MIKLRDQIPLDQFMTRQVRLWERNYRLMRQEERQRVAPSLTVSKALGSYGVELAERLSRRLGWQVFDKDLVEAIACNAKVRREMVEIFDERTQNAIHKWVLTLLDHESLHGDKFFKYLVTVLRSLGEHGEAIILGRGGNFVLAPERALRVMCVAPMATRVAYLQQHQSLDRREAQKRLEKADAERRAFIEHYYHRDPEDPVHYDLVLNMGTLTLAAAEEAVLAALRAKFHRAISA